MRLILASRSPRRRFLLAQLGVTFELAEDAHGLDEEALISTGSSAEEGLMELAEHKGRAVAQQYRDALVLSADTEVLLGGQALGKPADALAAERMLGELSGRQHHVVTAVSLQSSRLRIRRVQSAWTAVWFRELSWREISEYVAKEEPFDFAGGYAIQGAGAALVERIEGSHSNVVGLPLGLTARLLKEVGMPGVMEPSED